MRDLRRLLWAGLAAAATGAPAAAQVVGNAGATGGNLGNFTTNPNGTTTIGNTSGSTGNSSGSSGTTGSIGGTQLTVEKAPSIIPPSSYSTNNANSKVQSSNFLAPTYAELRLQGLLQNARNASFNPGGFGSPVFATTGGTGQGQGATATVGRAGQTGQGGAGGVLTTDPGGQLVQLPRQIAYPAQIKFAAPPMAAPRLQADLRGVLDRAPTLANPAAVQVQVEGTAVVLRGAVRDGEEARLVEGLVRLTPGVRQIVNELTYPR